MLKIIDCTATVESIQQDAHEIRTYTLKLPDDVDLGFKPGQWIMLFGTVGDKILSRPYSIASLPSMKGRIDICLKRIENGPISNFIFGLKEGDNVRIKGPYGVFTLSETDNGIIFVATGTGIAPFLSMIPHLLESGFNKDIWMIFGCRYEEDIIYKEYFEGLEKKYSNFRYFLTLSRPGDGWQGRKGYVQEILKSEVKDPKSKDIYICGIPRMVDEVQQLCHDMGFDKEGIHMEKY
ncbi:MAG: FAD-dependent oxidoreductase [Candidatus Aenigmarchaeota archaeon]|nr:FAD-dependent oxidoreductase [Candidatus Aenigmarchaeota archaeon]